MTWTVIGSVTIDSVGKLEFPVRRKRGGVYKFSIRRRDGSRLEYIGETDNVQRRFYHYRNPGPRQLTNIRINALFGEVLSEGGKIEIELANAWMALNGDETPANFQSKSIRCLFENFALAAGLGSEIEQLNR